MDFNKYFPFLKNEIPEKGLKFQDVKLVYPLSIILPLLVLCIALYFIIF